MKQIVFLLLLLVSFQSYSQLDTLVAYYENGQMKFISHRLDGELHGKCMSWYESGQLWSKGVWKNGERLKSVRYDENGRRNYLVRYRKWKMKLKMWHPNGQLWSISVSKYARSWEKEFDSTGVLQRKTIQKEGSTLACSVPVETNSSNNMTYEDCTCPWGKVHKRNGIYYDEKGRDLSSKYSSVRTEYYPNGSIWKITSWNNSRKSYTTQEWNEEGELISETTP